MILRIDEDNVLNNIVLSSSIVLEGETSEQQVNSIIEMLEQGGQRLKRWKEVIEAKFPSFKHDISTDKEVNIGKLGDGGAVTTDTCNSAKKTRRLLVNVIKRNSPRLEYS